jgi:nucleoid DNA-binding protein
VVEKAFKPFGTVISLDVVQTKKCAFVEFGTKEAYQQALMQKNIEIPGLGTVTVEERKQKNRSFYQVVPAPSTKTTRKGRDVNRELSLYVRGIVDGMNKTVIDKAFKTFGPVINLDVVPTKSCAFVEFGTKEAYQQALMQKTIEIPGLGTVTVEERKQKENKKNQNRYRYGKSL